MLWIRSDFAGLIETPKAGLLNKNCSLTTPLGVTKFTSIYLNKDRKKFGEYQPKAYIHKIPYGLSFSCGTLPKEGS
jgi:hypothetical protein